MTVRRRFLLVASLALASLTLAACGNLNTDKLEGVTKDEIQKDVGVTVAKVDCPSDVKAEKGVNFTCTATAKDGSTAKIDVVQTDDQGNVKISAPLLNIPQAEHSLEKELGHGTTVDCPASLILVEKGSTFSCSVTDSTGAKKVVKVTFTDDKGHTSYKVKPAG